MGVMESSTRTEILNALAYNFQEITQATGRISGLHSKAERCQALIEVTRLRKARRVMESKLKSIKGHPRASH
jgi:hypothetical protein